MPAGYELYDILGVSTTAGPDEIKKAYRQLALRYHPDKAGAEGVEQFKRVQEAYDVLSDPQRKKVYDTYGSEGLRVFGAGHMGDMPPIFVDLMVDSRLSLVLCFVLAAIVLFFLITPVLLVVRVDKHYSWPWWPLFLPPWIVLALATCCCGKGLGRNPENQDRRDVEPDTFFRLLCVDAFTVLLCLGLHGVIHHWALVFLPLYVLEALDLACVPRQLSRSAYEQKKHAVKAEMEEAGINEEMEFHSYREFLFDQLAGTICRPILLVLLTLKITGAMHAHWAIVFIPVYVYILYLVLLHFYSSFRGQRPALAECCMEFCLCCVILALVLGFVIPLNVKLARVDAGVGDSPKLAAVFIPVFLIGGLLVCCLCCCLPLIFRRQHSQLRRAAAADAEDPSGIRTPLSSDGFAADVPLDRDHPLSPGAQAHQAGSAAHPTETPHTPPNSTQHRSPSSPTLGAAAAPAVSHLQVSVEQPKAGSIGDID